MPDRRPVLETLCNECGARSIQHTRADAFAVLLLHEQLWGHVDQLWSSTYGWTRFHGLSYANCWVAD